MNCWELSGFLLFILFCLNYLYKNRDAEREKNRRGFSRPSTPVLHNISTFPLSPFLLYHIHLSFAPLFLATFFLPHRLSALYTSKVFRCCFRVCEHLVSPLFTWDIKNLQKPFVIIISFAHQNGGNDENNLNIVEYNMRGYCVTQWCCYHNDDGRHTHFFKVYLNDLNLPIFSIKINFF